MIKKTLILVFLLLTICFVNVEAQSKDNIASGPGTYKILNDAMGPVKIPFKMHNGKPLLELNINGEPATLMIDNGVLWDQVWLFGSPLVEKLKLIPNDEVEIGGAGQGDPTAAYTAENLTLEFDNIIFYEQPVLVSPAAAGFYNIFPGVDGQLCNTFFKHFIVEFDFENYYVILHDPKVFDYKGGGSVLEMTLNESGTHAVPFKFMTNDGKIYNDKVDIDFGGLYDLMIALNNKNNIQLPTDAVEVVSRGAQGKAIEYKAKIKSMTFGKYTFENPTVYYGDEEVSRIHPDNLGVIGLPLFMKFKIIFDYINGKMYVEPNKNFDQ